MLLLASGIDYDPLPESDTEAVHVYRTGDKITRLTAENLRAAAALGFSAVQIPAGDFFNRDLLPDGRGDWSELGANLAMLAEHDMGAVIVAGYHWIPPCLQGDPRVTAIRCLSHDEALPMLSLWSEFTYEWIERCCGALAEHLRPCSARIQAIHVSLYGDFGEAMFPAGGMNVGAGHERRVAGEVLHNHGDFWCNDACAREDYVRFRAERYANDGAAGVVDVRRPFPATPTDGQASREWFDFLEWYYAGMTRYAERVVKIFRHHFAQEELVIYLGGGIEPHTYGQDNTALPKAMKASGGIIRSTASASRMLGYQRHREPATPALALQRNYPIVKRIATACKLYEIPLWLEPPYPPGLEGPCLVARIFEAVSCGAAGYFEWTRTLQREQAVYERYRDLLTCEAPQVDVAVYFPVASHRSLSDSVLPERYWRGAAHARAVADFDVVDDRLIRDGALQGYAILLAPETEWIPADVFDKVTGWVGEGGILVGQYDDFSETRNGGADDRHDWFGVAAHGRLCRQVLCGAAGDEEMPLPQSAARFRQQSIMAFEAIVPEADALLGTSAAAAVVRRHHGKGVSLCCTASVRDDETELCVSVLQDLLDHGQRTRQLSARVGRDWVRNQPGVFATVLTEHVLLVNLSGRAYRLSHQGHDVELAANDLVKIPLQ